MNQNENLITIKRNLLSKSFLEFIGAVFLIFSITTTSFTQDNYLLDSVNITAFVAPLFFGTTHSKFFYDEDDMLIRRNSDSNYAIFTYEDRVTHEENYMNNTDFSFNMYSTYFNEDGFKIKKVYKRREFSTLIPKLMDSLILDSNNNVIEELSYRIRVGQTQYIYELTSRRTHQYENNNLVETTFFIYNPDTGELISQSINQYKYNGNDQLINHYLEVSYDGIVSRSNNINFYYNNSLLDYETITKYQNGITKNTRRDYSYNYPQMTIRNSLIDENDHLIHYQTEDYSRSTSDFYEFDSISVYDLSETDTIRTNHILNKQITNDNKERIEIRKLNRNFDDTIGITTDFLFYQHFYRLRNNSQIEDPNEPTEELESFLVFPNPNTVGSNIVINTPNINYNKLVIYNGTGQFIYEKSVSQNAQLVIANPIQTSGIYFIRLQLDDQASSDWQKLIIQ